MAEFLATLPIRLDVIVADLALALRNVARQRRRSALALASIVFGVIAYVLASGYIEWTLWGMREWTIRSQTGHFQVARKGFIASGAADPWAFLINDRSEEAVLRSFPGVLEVAPRITYTGLASLGDATLSFLGEGIDPSREGDPGRAVEMVSGRALDALEPHGVILGQGLALNLGANVGDPLILIANTRSGGISAVECKIRGIFATISKSYDDHAVRGSLALANELLRSAGIHKWVVFLEDTDATSTIVAKLRARFENRGLEVVPWFDLADFFNKTAALFRRQIGMVKAIIALIIILSISNTLTMAVMERTAEIGTSLALGVRRSQILRRFMIEGALVGLVGGIFGAMMGAALAALISAIGIPMPPPPGMARGYTAEITVTWALVLDAIVLALVTALIASVYPAWKASRLEIVDALRYSR